MNTPIPPWVHARGQRVLGVLEYVAPKPDKAKPLDPDQISNAFDGQFYVLTTRELEGLDVWFIEASKLVQLTNDEWPIVIKYEIILYEHMGEWKCSSITKVS